MGDSEAHGKEEEVSSGRKSGGVLIGRGCKA